MGRIPSPSAPERGARPRRGTAPEHRAATSSPVDERTTRLAELVEGLTGAGRGASLHAVRTGDDDGAADALEVVARAMVQVDQPTPVRMAAYLDRVLPGEPEADPAAASRRWDRAADHQGPDHQGPDHQGPDHQGADPPGGPA